MCNISGYLRNKVVRGQALSNSGQQLEILANFIMVNVPGEPSKSEGAGECAVRIIRELQQSNERLRSTLNGGVLDCLICKKYFPVSQMFSVDACCEEHQAILNNTDLRERGRGAGPNV